MRDGEPYKDEFFGEVNIYTTPLFVEVPLATFAPVKTVNDLLRDEHQ